LGTTAPARNSVHPRLQGSSRAALAVMLGCALVFWSSRAWSDDQNPSGAGAPAAPLPRGASTSADVSELTARLRAMEETNRKLAERLDRATREHDQQMRMILEKYENLAKRLGEGTNGDSTTRPSVETQPPPNLDQGRARDTPVPDYTEGQFAPFTPAPGYPLTDATTATKLPLKSVFGPGFQFQTEDEEFRLRIHYESQIEGRIWGQREQVPANSGFFLPRQRIFFNGNITKPIEYEFSINRGFGNLNLLNAYINVHFDDRLEVRFGRFFTPLPYDQYAISNYWLPTPERSIFTTNVGLNRQFGMMAWGYLFDKRVDYAAGAFNGSRNSFESLNNAADFVGYLNTRPFQESEALPFLRFLNLGTSVAFGRQNQAAVPMSFRIGGGSPTADVPGPGTTPFLILNPGVLERGDRLVGSVHAAYFYKSLSLIGEWQYGYGNYALSTRSSSVQVPFSGFYVTASYFLTGEEVERRSRVYPRRPLIRGVRRDQGGPGAWEIVGRVSELRLGDQIFTGGFADRDLWSNQALTTELGLNWYWNEYIKIYMFWLHGDFGEPVLYRPGAFQKTADMFWLRFQLYF
jgi:phosphate-selective porin OprO/OprP